VTILKFTNWGKPPPTPLHRLTGWVVITSPQSPKGVKFPPSIRFGGVLIFFWTTHTLLLPPLHPPWPHTPPKKLRISVNIFNLQMLVRSLYCMFSVKNLTWSSLPVNSLRFFFRPSTLCTLHFATHEHRLSACLWKIPTTEQTPTALQVSFSWSVVVAFRFDVTEYHTIRNRNMFGLLSLFVVKFLTFPIVSVKHFVDPDQFEVAILFWCVWFVLFSSVRHQAPVLCTCFRSVCFVWIDFVRSPFIYVKPWLQSNFQEWSKTFSGWNSQK
jgi:hypothetical protein